MSLFRKICLVSFLLLGVLVYFIGTASGLRFLLYSAARWVPALEISAVNGGWNDLIIKQLRYQISGVTLIIGELHLALDFSCLLQHKLCINNLTLRNVNISANNTKLKSLVTTNLDGSFVSVLYPLILRHLILYNVQVSIDNTKIAIDNMSTGFQFRDNRLIIMPTRIVGLLVKCPTVAHRMVTQLSSIFTKTIKLGKSAPKKKCIDTLLPLVKTLCALLTKPLLPPLPSFTMPFNLTIVSIDGENLRLSGALNLFITHLSLQAATYNQHVKLILLNIDSPQHLIHASGNIELGGSWPVAIKVNTTLNSASLKRETIKIGINGSLRDELRIVLHFYGPLTAQSVLKIYPEKTGLPLLALVFCSKSLQWPLISASPQYQVRDVIMHLTASQGKDDPINAVINLQHAIIWRGDLSLSGIITSQQSSCLAQVYGKMTISGSLYGDNWQLQVPKLDLRGYVNQNTLIIKGSLNGNSAGQWQVPQFLFTLGRNQLHVKGKLHDVFALDATLNAPLLKGVFPDLEGRATGSIKLRGNLNHPKLFLDLDAYAMHWKKLNIARILLHGSVCLSNIIHGDIRLRLDYLQRNTFSIAHLSLGLAGNEKQHQLKLVTYGKSLIGRLQINGNFNRQQQHWRGILGQANLNTPLGEWQLTRDITLNYRTIMQKIVIGPYCWQNIHAQICAPQHVNIGASGRVSLLLNQFYLAISKPILPFETQVSGIFTGQVDMQWTTGNILPQGKISLVGSNVKSSQIIQGKTIPINFDMITLNIILDQGLARLDWLVKVTGNGQFNGQIQVINHHQKQHALSGNINVHDFSLSLLRPLLSRNENVNGLLNIVLRLSGSIKRPQLYGQLCLERMSIKGNFMPFSMIDSQLTISFTGNNSTLQGFIGTTHGQINLIGTIDWNRIQALHARINAQGNRVRISLLPMAQLDMSPDIMFDISPALLTINGKIDIPWSRVTLKDMPQNVIGVSDDEVLLDEKLQQIPYGIGNTVIPIVSNLLVHIGQDVRINAFGLRARLMGKLKLAQNREELIINGQLRILSGYFHVYGQDLIINKGQLLFSGPANHPYLNIEAIRNPDFTEDNVIAGIRMTVLAGQPKIEIFSNPLKSQQEALSYLLRGQSLDASGIDNNTMTSMLIGLGVAQGGQVMGKIGQVFGVSKLALDTLGLGNKSQVVVSGYIMPCLQVKYGMNIFDSLTILTLRYYLIPRLYLETVFGFYHALDLLYQFEF